MQMQIMIQIQIPDSTNQSDGKISPANQGDQSDLKRNRNTNTNTNTNANTDTDTNTIAR